MFLRMTAKLVSILRFSCLMICVKSFHLSGPDFASAAELLVVIAVETVLGVRVTAEQQHDAQTQGLILHCWLLHLGQDLVDQADKVQLNK